MRLLKMRTIGRTPDHGRPHDHIISTWSMILYKLVERQIAKDFHRILLRRANNLPWKILLLFVFLLVISLSTLFTPKWRLSEHARWIGWSFCFHEWPVCKFLWSVDVSAYVTYLTRQVIFFTGVWASRVIHIMAHLVHNVRWNSISRKLGQTPLMHCF